jgi:hypothetical protein
MENLTPFCQKSFEEIVARNSVASQLPFTRVCFPDGIGIYNGDSDALPALDEIGPAEIVTDAGAFMDALSSPE